MSKSFVTLIVVVAGWLGLQQYEKYRKAHPEPDSGPVLKVDKRAARKAIASMDQDWKVAADHFASGDFNSCRRMFEAGLAHLQEFTFRYGSQPYEKGLTLDAWLAAHQAGWAASLAGRRPELTEALAHQADITALAKLRQRLADPKFEELHRDVRAEVANLARSHAGVLVIELYEGQNDRRSMSDAVAQLRGPTSNLYLLFGNGPDIASLGDLPYLGLLRATVFERVVRYGRDSLASQSSAERSRGRGTDNIDLVGLVVDMQLLLEPDPYARRNFGLTRKVCATPTLNLPERFEVSELTAWEYAMEHRAKVGRTLAGEVGKLSRLNATSGGSLGYCTLAPLPVLAGGAMPDLTSDSDVVKDFGRAR